jgi:hypothetical protein
MMMTEDADSTRTQTCWLRLAKVAPYVYTVERLKNRDAREARERKFRRSSRIQRFLAGKVPFVLIVASS